MTADTGAADVPRSLPTAPPIRPERLVTFVDAIIAIAITLLVLPLADLVTEAAAHGEPAVSVLRDNIPAFAAFLLSFATIVQVWITHHGLMRRVELVTLPFIVLTMLWLLLVVTLPFVTQMVGTYGGDPFLIRTYTGVWLLIAVVHCATGVAGGAFRRRMALWPALLVLCLAVELVVPSWGYYPLLLLLVAPLLVVGSTRGDWA